MFSKKARSAEPVWRGTFHDLYDCIDAPVCLCDGLEIIDTNLSFQSFLEETFGIDTPRFLNHLLKDQAIIDTLFSGQTGPVLSSVLHADGRHWQSLEVTRREAGFAPSLSLISFCDRTEQQYLRHRVREASRKDPSTGLLLPASFLQEMQQRMLENCKQGIGITHCQISIRPGGDEVWDLEQKSDFLITLQDRLREVFGDHCINGLTGTACIACLLDGGNSLDDARRLATQLSRIFRVAAELYLGKASACTMKLGFSHAAAGEEAAIDLQNRAALALETANRSALSIVAYDQELERMEERRARLLSDLAPALVNSELEAHFQPVVLAEGGSLIGFEALVRWQHPVLGRIPPPEIVESAKSASLMLELTIFMVRQTLEEAARWPPTIRFAVNVSPDQIGDALVDMVRRELKLSGIDPSRLEIEVTEEAMAGDFDHAVVIFDRLRAIGVHIAMDDFGAGATSINNLQRLSFSKIKIDKCITDGLPHDPRAVAIIRSLMFLARQLGLAVTVEGIEEQEQLEILSNFHCGIQGYLFSPPLPRNRIDEMRHRLVSPDGAPRTKNKVLAIGPRPAMVKGKDGAEQAS